MVAGLLPSLRTPKTPFWQMLLPAHFTAASTWVEALRLTPHVPREHRISYYNGLGTMLTMFSLVATALGFLLASELPQVLAAAVLFLTADVVSGRDLQQREDADRQAGARAWSWSPRRCLRWPSLISALLVGGLAAGTIAYAVDRWRRAR